MLVNTGRASSRRIRTRMQVALEVDGIGNLFEVEDSDATAER